ncbi:S8 family serine peptidase [Longispora albida]|uniref:S8 family serine peptidase n=1 Tax=Longispora albida TaxID=203523 RepID=UPI00039E8DA6|nr:S8 family serine peptidase [Longispora albida]
MARSIFGLGIRTAVLGLTVAASAGLAAAIPGPAWAQPEGPVISVAREPIPGHYVVFFREGSHTLTAEAIGKTSAGLASKYGGQLRSVWETAVHGFSVTGLSERGARRLAADPAVREVRQSGTARATDEQPNPPSYGLDRVDQKNLPLDSLYTYSGTASNVTVYVTDSGIKYGHEQFEGRATLGADFINDGREGEDCFGHGTHVSGTIGGKTVGVAKKVKLVSVRMLGLNCGNTGPDSAGVDALNWIARNAVKPAVVNMSWGFDDAHIGDAALKAVNDAGIPMVAASGNNGSDGCTFGPGGVYAPIINVGNSNKTDYKSGTSNHGRCLDLWAPGENIYSAYHSSNSAYSNMTGTSMASPHVAGAVALYLQNNANATPAQVHDFIVNGATPNVLQGNIGTGSPNKLLYSRNEGGPPQGSDFSIGVSPSSVTVDRGGSISASVSTTVVSGTAETVNLTASGLPAGATATFQPSSVTAGGQAKLSIAAASSTAPGTYPVKVTGTTASATHDATLSLVVRDPSGTNDFSIGVDPSTTTVEKGGAVSVAVSTTVVSGTAETVNLSASGVPAGVTAAFVPSSVTAGEGAKLNLSASSSAQPGTYPIKVTGTATSATHDATVSLVVKDPSGTSDFSLSLSPSSAAIQAGQSTTASLSTAVVTGPAETISLAASNVPAGVTATLDPTSVTAGDSAILTITTTASAAAGTYQISITGTAPSATHSTTFTLTVTRPDPPSGGIVNGGFESGSLTGWTASGTAGVTTPGRTGSYAGKVGGGPGTSSISQTFTAGAGKSVLNLHFRQSGCTTFNDPSTIELVNTATGFKQTLANQFCFNGTLWFPAQAGVTAGQSYTLTIRHTTAGGSSSVAVDDVTLS